MRNIVVSPSRKRAVNQPAVLQALRTDLVAQQLLAHQTHRQQASQAALVWNDFNAAKGSFADEYSTL